MKAPKLHIRLGQFDGEGDSLPAVVLLALIATGIIAARLLLALEFIPILW